MLESMPYLITLADEVVVQAYDSHCNLVLGEVEETVYVVDEEEDNDEDNVRTVKKQSEMLFVRGWSPSTHRLRRI